MTLVNWPRRMMNVTPEPFWVAAFEAATFGSLSSYFALPGTGPLESRSALASNARDASADGGIIQEIDEHVHSDADPSCSHGPAISALRDPTCSHGSTDILTDLGISSPQADHGSQIFGSLGKYRTSTGPVLGQCWVSAGSVLGQCWASTGYYIYVAYNLNLISAFFRSQRHNKKCFLL
jgi:hypothetical protein